MVRSLWCLDIKEGMEMKWFHFSVGTKKNEKAAAKPPLFVSSSYNSTEYGLKISGSEINSQNVSDISTCSTDKSPHANFPKGPSSLRLFTYQDLRSATRNFSRSMMIGEGGFGRVYRGTIKDLVDPQRELEVAVKQLNRHGFQGHKEWSAEVNVLGVSEHPNLVKLLGYCAEDDERGMQRLLVYEFIPNKSVEDHLSFKSSATLSWPMRLKIALDAASGLKYLHEGMEFQIIFRDFKTSNILLDEEWNAKLSDFGMARHGPLEGLTHVSTAVVGTHGYAAPEYVQTGRLTAKSDIWSYGVVLYELITGRRPIDHSRPKGEQKLLEWIRPYVANPKTFPTIIDPRLDGQYSIESVFKLRRIANKCLASQPKSRPNMSQILEMVQAAVDAEVIESTQPPLVACASEKDTKMENKNLKRKRLVNWRRLVQLDTAEGCCVWRLWRSKAAER